MNKKSSKLLKRKSIRLKNFDYSSQGLYFITICVHNRVCLLGDISNIDNPVGAIHESPDSAIHESPVMVLNKYGMIVKKHWQSLPNRFPILLDKYIIMPNHIHGIIHIINRAHRDAPLRGHKRSVLSQCVGYFKMNTAKQINILNKTPGQHLFQRNFYEHIIRNENDLNEIREYIKNNPQMWDRDRDNPAKSGIANK